MKIPIKHLSPSSVNDQILATVGGKPTYTKVKNTMLDGLSPSSGEIVFASTGGSFGSSTSLFWDDSSKFLGIGTSTPESAVHVVGTTFNSSAVVARRIGNPVKFVVDRAEGTVSTPTAVLSGSNIGGLLGRGYDGTTFSNAATVNVLAAEAFNGTAHGSHLTFETIATGTTTLTERVRITSAGKVGIGTSNPATELHLSSAAPVLTATSTNAVSGFRIDVLGLDGNTDDLLRVQDSGTTRMLVFRDGDTVVGGTSADDGERLEVIGKTTVNDGINILNTVKNAHVRFKTNSETWFIGNDGQNATGAFFINNSGSSTNRVTVLTDGKVGIGTQTPVTSLEVSSTTAGQIRSVADSVAGTTTASAVFMARANPATTMADGFGAGYAMNINGNTICQIMGIRDGADNSGAIKFLTASTGALTGRMWITSAGKVGVGNAAPAEKLHVNGAILVGTTTGTIDGTIRWTGADFEGRASGSWVSLTATTSPAGSSGQVQFNSSGSFGASSDLYWDNGNGRLSIGAGTSPTARLHVKQTLVTGISALLVVGANSSHSQLVLKPFVGTNDGWGIFDNRDAGAGDGGLTFTKDVLGSITGQVEYLRIGEVLSSVITTRFRNATVRFDDNGIQVGSPTGGDKGAGTINVSGDVFKNGTAYNNPDYVFEHYFTGKIVEHAEKEGAAAYTGRMPLKDLRKYAATNYRFPQIGGGPMGMFSRADCLLEIVEEQATYIFELEERLAKLEDKLTA